MRLNSSEFLQRRIQKLSKMLTRIKKKLNRLSITRLICFGVFLSLSLTYYLSRTDNYYYLLPILFSLALFIGLVFYYRKIEYFKLRLVSYENLLKRETLRAEFKLDTFYDYDIAINKYDLKNHFHKDLGVSGKNGLFTYLNTTKTVGGEKLFLENLLRLKLESLEKILSRQKLVKEISSKKYLPIKILRILEEAHLEESSDKIHLAPLFQYHSKFFETKKILSLIYKPYIIIVWLISIFLFLLDLPSISFSLFFINTILFILNRKETSHALKSFKNIQEEIPALEKLASYLSGSSFQLDINFSVVDKVETKKMFRKLDKIITRISIQNAPLIHFTLNMLFLWDLWQLTALAKWQKEYKEKIKTISENIETIDSILPFVVLKFHNPQYQFPEIDSKFAELSAVNMGHPLITSSHRVSNPLKKIKTGESLIITGSNMSGKTTYLRTIGLNVLLGLCGSPVSADKMEFPPMEILSSIKNEDSLEEGISFFYAEVKRIAHILNRTKEEGKYLILLDELLKGTNTRERLIASKAIVQKLMKSNSVVFITTHDVDLAIKTKKQKVAHFTETVKDNRMSFDYKIKDGVIRSTNALRILAIENLDLDL
ncbi:MAG: DNA mismatch repair protein [Leptospiraceae bacterium]|nr:DNA mismatch repair protein [Leptospiraceae bacterium]